MDSKPNKRRPTVATTKSGHEKPTRALERELDRRKELLKPLLAAMRMQRDSLSAKATVVEMRAALSLSTAILNTLVSSVFLAIRAKLAAGDVAAAIKQMEALEFVIVDLMDGETRVLLGSLGTEQPSAT
jgi:hypothetical protein